MMRVDNGVLGLAEYSLDFLRRMTIARLEEYIYIGVKQSISEKVMIRLVGNWSTLQVLGFHEVLEHFHAVSVVTIHI